MRFARAFVRADTGELIAIAEGEAPLHEAVGVSKMIRHSDGAEVQVLAYDLGLFEHFDPTHTHGGECSPSEHLFQRTEHDGNGGFRSKAGHALPRLHDCPCTLEGIKERLRGKGPSGIPTMARAWLTLKLPEQSVRALGIGAGITEAHLRALGAIRERRDASIGSRRANLEQGIQKQSDARSARALSRRPAQEE